MSYKLHDPITEDDLKRFSKHLPDSANDLIRLLGMDDAIKLFNSLSGAQIRIPRSPCSRQAKWQWKYISNILGSHAMKKLASEYGGTVLDISVLNALRIERRSYHIVAAFDALTAKEPKGKGYSRALATVHISLEHVPITCRQVANIIDRYVYTP